MNYYPFFGMNTLSYPTQVSRGLFSRLFSTINFSSILNNTQKTLNFVNQAIPVVKQISPLMKNTKTMFKIMNEFKKTDTKKLNNIPNSSKNKIKEEFVQIDNTTATNSPTFFL